MNTCKSTIKNISAKTIFNSKKEPTAEALLETAEGVFSFAAPSGISAGQYEAVSLPAQQAVKNIREIIGPKLAGQKVIDQAEIDKILLELDGAFNKASLGANALLAVSIANLRAGAHSQKMPLWQWISRLAGSQPRMPRAFLLLGEGGRHGQTALALQEFMAVQPAGIFKDGFEKLRGLYQSLEKVLGKKFLVKGVLTGQEGGFTPPLDEASHFLDLIMKASQEAGFENEIKIALDAAASEFFKEGLYHLEGKKMTSGELAEFYLDLAEKFPLFSLEDPFSENDWPGWQALNLKLKSLPGGEDAKLLLIGDDLTATNPERIKRAGREKACSAVIIKPNQIGTFSEVLEAVKEARSFGWPVIVSHRGGETKDDFIADLAVGLGAEFIKTGGPFKPERRAKYDRLLAIEKEL